MKQAVQQHGEKRPSKAGWRMYVVEMKTSCCPLGLWRGAFKPWSGI